MRILLLQLVVYVPPFYAAEIGLDIAAIGFVFFLARGWDAVIDPLVGNLSDGTRSRWGRRKPWMAIGTPIAHASGTLLAKEDTVSNQPKNGSAQKV